MKKLYKKSNHGISLISLIITIIVIIILAAIVIFSGLNTPDRANFAKFAQNFSDYNTTIMGDYTKKKTQYAVSGQSRTDAQIYYIIATGNENSVDVNDAPTAVATIEKLGLNLHPEQLSGTEYYEITSDSNIEGINKQKQFYEAGEKHYVTDAGEAFVLPGYLVPGTNRWYINEKKYYESDEPIKGPFSFDISEWKLLSANDINSTEVEGKLEKDNESAYIYFTATANGEPATISYTPSSGGETISDTGKILLSISDNGEYNFTITAEVDGIQKTTTKKIMVENVFIKMTPANAFKFDSSTGTIKGLENKYINLEEVIIPTKINGIKVTSIGYEAFRGYKNLVNVTILEGVTNISDFAFYQCSSLISITIPKSITSMGIYTFAYCSNLANVTIPEGLTTIEEYTFNGCSSLASITLPKSITSIKKKAFDSCTNLTNIVIPESVTSIGDDAFSQCDSLTQITIPKSVTVMEGVFGGCDNLTDVVIYGNIERINSFTFASCRELTNVTIPSSVQSIGAQAFVNCSKLKDVYYEGTETQWNSIPGHNISPLSTATKHYNSTGPSTP